MASAETNKQHSIPRESPAEISLESTDPVTQSATAVDSSDMAALTRAVIRNTTTAEPSDSATPFTQQQSPLLRLPAELRNRIYGEVFRSFFEDLEKRRASTWGEQNPVDPKEIRPLLGGLTICRQFHQEAMPLLFRTFLARQPHWCLSEQKWISDLFLRSASFCQIVKRYAPHMRFSIALLRNPRDSFCPEYVKPLLEELARQLQEDVKLTFHGVRHALWNYVMTETAGELVWKPGHQSPYADAMSPDTVAWNNSWTSEDVRFQAKCSVGQYHFRYSWMIGMESGSGLCLDGCLAQLD
jgi:hypothetical protein